MDKLMQLAAILLENKVVVEDENGELKSTLRVSKGQHIRVVSGTILDVRTDAPANYSILDCKGDVFSTQLELELIGNDGSEYKLILK
jgi:hypothetical protein